MNIQLSEHFTYNKLFRFTFPSIIMMIFTSIYGVVDGFFVSNLVGKTEFTAINMIYPVIMILGAIGFMFGTGGSALIAKTMGEGKEQKAKEQFSLFVYVSFVGAVVIAVLGVVFLRPIASLLGAQGGLLDNCVVYGRILILALPAYVLQYEFQSFFITAEKPQLGLWVTIAAGVTNMVLDGLFMGPFGWGIAGAAVATALSLCVGGMVPLLYFVRKNRSRLQLIRTRMDGGALVRACFNGSSELMSNIAMSLISILYNVQLLRYAGEDGVAAYGVLMYVSMIFLAIFIGYSIGTAPVISFHYGAGNQKELKSLLKKSTIIIVIASFVMVVLSLVLATPLSYIFVGYDKTLLELTKHAFFVFSFMFLFAGINIFSSSFFTALNNGVISALLSFLRTLVFQVTAVFLLPLFFGMDGIWGSIVIAELLAGVMALVFLLTQRKRYHY